MNKKPNIWIFSLEPLPTRYTAQWHSGIPELLSEPQYSDFNIRQIDGVQNNTEVTKGAFLNFSDTNYWKSSQLLAFLECFNRGETTPNDRFLFTDFWNPTVIQLKYMKDLLGFNWQIDGITHAGSYDPQDFLGRLVPDKRWSLHFELSMFHAFDHLYFATQFHIDMFVENVLRTSKEFILKAEIDRKLVRSGQPHNKLIEHLSPYAETAKRDLILFPHRIAPEKQVEIFLDLAQALPEYEFVVCQDKKLSKDEYHQLLGSSKMVFSANLQETLGISSAIEAPVALSLPCVPNRLSYTEIFENYPEFAYPSEWTTDWDSYITNKSKLIEKIKYMMVNYDKLVNVLKSFNTNILPSYANADVMFKQLTH